MTIDELAGLFEKHSDVEYIRFEAVEPKRSRRPDLHAFLLLDELVPGASDIVGSSHHDEFYLSVGGEELAKVATEAQVIELVRCGVRFDDDTESLCMFA